MKKLYSAHVARPLATANTPPTRLGFATTAWCRYEDLVAAISGCGAVAVFHADSPGEVTLLVGPKRAPARHVIWRHSPDQPAMLVVADAAGRITFWLARDRRVNVWTAVGEVDLPAVAVAVGWNKSCTALAAVLAHGGLAVWSVRDVPLNEQQRPAPDKLDSNARYARRPVKMTHIAVRSIPCTTQKLPEMFGGQLRCATVAPGHVDPTTVALVTVSAADPRRLNVWQVSISKTANPVFEVKSLSSAEMDATEDGRCVDCAAVPKSGMLFAVGDRGVIARWCLKHLRPTGEWILQQKTRIEKETEDAANRGIIPRYEDNRNLMVNAITRGLQMSRQRKVYAFEVCSDPKRLVTSTAAGLFVWDTDKLNIVAGHVLKKSSEGSAASPYWGLCISPGGAAVMALNGQGRVDTYSLISPLTQDTPESVNDAAMSVARRLTSTTYTDGLRGGWDIIAAVASEGPATARLVATFLTPNHMRSAHNPSVTSEKLGNLKSLMMRLVDVQDSTAYAAKRLLDVAVHAIRQSAPDYVKLKLAAVKDPKQLFSVDNIQEHIQQGVSSTRVTLHQLAAASLADWIMVLCAVWLQRCAAAVLKLDSKGQMGSAWASLGAMSSYNTQDERGRGMVRDPVVIHMLRTPAVAAAVLVALETEHGEPDTDPRYFRFSREESAQIVAALWEISVTWNFYDSGTQPIANSAQPNAFCSDQNPQHAENTALAFRKHEAAALAISRANKLRVIPAEKALGLHGSAIGSGFVMSCARKWFFNEPNTVEQDGNRMSGKTEWCPFDVVTGRPLPPWAPLRRCVVSGLLAAEITQQKSEYPISVNGASPWISKWAHESPFGGRWARVPSLDLDRYELLPSAILAANRGEHANAAAHRAKMEDVLSQQEAALHNRAQLAGHQGYAMNTGANPDANSLPAAAPVNQMGAALANGNSQLPQNMQNLPANAILQGAFAGRLGPAARNQASPRMSTASSTTDAGSSVSKQAKKRASSSTRGRVRKRAAAETRTPTASQLSDLQRTMGLNGMPGAASASPYGRAGSVADAMSTDTRSTMTTATNATGGVDQDTSKTGRRSRKRAKKKGIDVDQATKQAVEVAATAAAAAAAASAPGTISQSVPGSLPPGVPQGVGNPSPGSQAAQVSRAGSHPKLAQSRGNERSQITAVAHAAAAAAAAAAASNKQSPMGRNSGMIPTNLSPESFSGAGMNKAVDAMSQLGFVPGNPMGSAVNPSGLAMAANQRRGNLVSGAHAVMMGNGNPTNLALDGSALQQGTFSLQGVADGNLAGLNGQTPTDVSGLQQLASANGPGGIMANVGPSLASLAHHLGLTPNQFNGFTPEQAQQTYDALSRRAAFQSAAGLGHGLQGTPPGAAPTQNMMLNASTSPTASDINGAVAAQNMSRMGAGSAGLPLGANVQQAGRGLMAGGVGLGSMGMPMNTPRSSAAESQTSARVGGASGAGPGMQSNLGGPSPGDRDSTSTGAGVGTGNQNATAAPPAANGPPGYDRGRYVWTGTLHLSGLCMDMTVTAKAMQLDFNQKPPLRDANGWPRQLDLHAHKLKNKRSLFAKMNAPESQWYVRFVPVDEKGQQREDPKLLQCIMQLNRQEFAYEVRCDEVVGNTGALYVWGMNAGPTVPHLIGVWRPDDPRPPPDLGVDPRLPLML